MADIDLKTLALTPTSPLPTTGFLFGADSQPAASPSVYGVATAITAILGNAASSDELIFNSDTTFARSVKGARNFRFGAADASPAQAQTLNVQSVVAGTTNGAGAAFTINGSQGTGSGAGGTLIFQVAPAGGSGTLQNALVPALTINADNASFGSRYSVFIGRVSATSFMTLSGTNKVTASDTTNGYCVATGFGYTFTGSGDATTSIDLRLSRNAAGIVQVGTTANNALGTLKAAVVGTTTAYTVATLPTGFQGARAFVTDATLPTYLGALTGGGAVVCPVFYNGTAWVSA
jgi:hypothetical protein